jgi:hypothetical protein
MALPGTVRVKLSSEAAGAIALTPVVVQELPLTELAENVLAVTGKDTARVREILRRGSLVSGASRFRWAGWEIGDEDLRELFSRFPDPDPSRTFLAAACTRAVLTGGRRPLEFHREAAARKRMLRGTSFWDVLMHVACAQPPVYAGYSYRERADRFRRELNAEDAGRLREGSEALAFPTLREQLLATAFGAMELYATRDGVARGA